MYFEFLTIISVTDLLRLSKAIFLIYMTDNSFVVDIWTLKKR